MPTLEFKGKQFVYAHHLSVPFRTLEVDRKKSLPPKDAEPNLDDNLIIHGDNLHALKALLPTYAGKVDCIFIDPPYNTGNEGWCYNDNVRSPLMQEWLKKEANPVDKEDMERHDKWCCMMWPRLNLLYDLLADDGVLVVTIDDNEQHRLRCLLDEIFRLNDFSKEQIGAFYADVAWQKKYATSNDAKGFSTMFDHVLVYRKSEEFKRKLLERTAENDANYTLEDNKGVFRIDNYTCNKTAAERPNLYYPITNPNTGEECWPKKSRVWGYSPETHAEHVENDMLWWGKDGKGRVPGFKRYRHLLRGGGGTVPSTWWPHEFASHTDEAKKTLRGILGKESAEFFTPKPVKLIQRILEICTDENSIVLDSFAGSGTTAHAVLEANKKDGGSRKFILVECEEYADKMTAERVRRVMNGYEFTGTQKEELYSKKLNFPALKKMGDVLGEIDGIENLEKARFDKISKTVKNNTLTVTGEKKVKERTKGLGGSFTYCTLGAEINLENLLRGENLPDYEALAKYVFYTATGQTLAKVSKPKGDWFIGETETYRVHLIYQADQSWLQSNESALSQSIVNQIEKHSGGKKCLVFASAKFMGQKELTKKRIEFCQLPYAIYRILGD